MLNVPKPKTCQQESLGRGVLFPPLPWFSLCPMMVICLSGELNQELLETVLSKLYNVKSPLAHPKQGWQEGDDVLAEVEQALCMLNTSNH